MHRPLISHPTRGEESVTYTDEQLTPHGDLRLTAHTQTVADRAVRLYGETDESVNYLRAVAALHDFGKATPQFQAYVRPDETARCPEEETTHARLGALATWYVLGELDAPDRDRLAGTLAVARHHQALPNAAQYTAETLARAFEQGDGVIQAQLDGIDNMWPGAAADLLEQTPLPNPNWDDLYTWAMSGEVPSELRELSTDSILGGYRLEKRSLPDQLYDRTLRYWSALTLADKTHAMDIPDDWIFDLDTLDQETIEDYIAELRDGQTENDLQAGLNDERERARRQAIRGVHEWLDDSTSQIATLTLPTGLGKTFTGLSAAFETRDILSDDSTAPRPIIYALPYTSIIEQTRAIFEDPRLWGADPQRSALTVHHYLSETVVHHDEYAATDTTDTDNDTVEFLGEAWRDGTILTTFVQLFESLTGPSNKQGVKLPALESSIVILDEPQALPKDWWNGITRLLSIMTEEYDARVIAMTATQPGLVRNMQTDSLLQAGLAHTAANCTNCQQGRTYETSLPPVRQEAYFEHAGRVRYTIDSTALSPTHGRDETHVGYESAADRIIKATDEGGSTLAICNTIGSSRELTDVLRRRPSVSHLGGVIENVLEEHNVNAADPTLSIEDIADKVLRRVISRDDPEVSTSDSIGSQQEENSSVSARTYILTLNSRYRPFDREVLINLSDRLSTSNEQFILVSTQAIEAGVDVTFRTVFRDIAPLDSIVQAAGRCNRSYEWGANGGQVIVWMLADPDAETPEDPDMEPPAYYVYEKEGIPSHIELIADVLDQLPEYTDIADSTLSQDAVTSYFEAIDGKSLWNGDLQEAINNADARWLGQQSLIGGVPTFDVLVGQTDADETAINHISEPLSDGDPNGFDRLQDASNLRVSLSKPVIEDAPRVPRIDRQERNSEGVQVFQFCGGSDLEYDLTTGGLQLVDDAVSDRFTI